MVVISILRLRSGGSPRVSFPDRAVSRRWVRVDVASGLGGSVGEVVDHGGVGRVSSSLVHSHLDLGLGGVPASASFRPATGVGVEAFHEYHGMSHTRTYVRRSVLSVPRPVGSRRTRDDISVTSSLEVIHDARRVLPPGVFTPVRAPSFAEVVSESAPREFRSIATGPDNWMASVPCFQCGMCNPGFSICRYRVPYELEVRLDGRWEPASGLQVQFLERGEERLTLEPLPYDQAVNVARKTGFFPCVDYREVAPDAGSQMNFCDRPNCSHLRNLTWAECHYNPANRICCHCGGRGNSGEECEVLKIEGMFAVGSYFGATTAVTDTAKLSVERLHASFIPIRFGRPDEMITLFRVEGRYGKGLDIPSYVKCHETLRVSMRDRIARMFQRICIDVPDLNGCDTCAGWDNAGEPTLPSQDLIALEPGLEAYKQLLRMLHQKLSHTGMCPIAWRGALFMNWGKDGCTMSQGSWTPIEPDALALWKQRCDPFPGQCLFCSITLPRHALAYHLFQVQWQRSYKQECVSALRCCIAGSNECRNVDGSVYNAGGASWAGVNLDRSFRIRVGPDGASERTQLLFRSALQACLFEYYPTPQSYVDQQIDVSLYHQEVVIPWSFIEAHVAHLQLLGGPRGSGSSSSSSSAA